jgi:hypothetical protein
MTEILSPLVEYLEDGLKNDPYQLQKAIDNNDLDGAINILARYLKENQVLLKYKTDDFDEKIRGKFKKGKFKTFTNIDEALSVLKKGLGKKFKKKIENYLNSLRIRSQATGESFNETGAKNKISQYILAEINQAIYYFNAQETFKEIQKSLEYSLKKVKISTENKQLEKERRREGALQTVFELVGVNYTELQSVINTELYDVQPEIRKKIAENEVSLKILQKRLTALEKGLDQTRKNLELAGIDPDKDENFINKQKLVEKTKTELNNLNSEKSELIESLKESLQKVLNAWNSFEEEDSGAFNAITPITASLADEVDALKILVRNSGIARGNQKQVYNALLKLNNSETTIDRKTTDQDLKSTAKILLSLERRLLELQNELQQKQKELMENKFIRDELIKFQEKIDRKLAEIKRLLLRYN